MKAQITTQFLLIFGFVALFACDSSEAQKVNDLEYDSTIVVGAERMETYLPKLLNKRVAVVANQTSLVHQTHLVDTLLSRGVKVSKVFAPEHGFRGNAAAGDGLSREDEPLAYWGIVGIAAVMLVVMLYIAWNEGS